MYKRDEVITGKQYHYNVMQCLLPGDEITVCPVDLNFACQNGRVVDLPQSKWNYGFSYVIITKLV